MGDLVAYWAANDPLFETDVVKQMEHWRSQKDETFQHLLKQGVLNNVDRAHSRKLVVNIEAAKRVSNERERKKKARSPSRASPAPPPHRRPASRWEADFASALRASCR